jgi:hypothetical protein
MGLLNFVYLVDGWSDVKNDVEVDTKSDAKTQAGSEEDCECQQADLAGF